MIEDCLLICEDKACLTPQTFFALSAFQHTNLSSKLFLLTARTRLLGEVGLYIRGFVIRQFLNEADTSSNTIGV